jgi:hypothetical protein
MGARRRQGRLFAQQLAAQPYMGLEGMVWPADWIRALLRSRAHGWAVTAERVAVELATPALFLAISAVIIVLFMTPTTGRDFRSSRPPLAGTNGR